MTDMDMTDFIIVDDATLFFAPVSSDLIDGLLGQYNSMRQRITHFAGMIEGELSAAMEYFLDGNGDEHNRFKPSVQKLFNPAGAIAALNAAYWSKTLAMTDVLSVMPQKRRDEWNKTISEMTAPDFTAEAVRPTISDLLASRQKFFAERVEGIFRGLSGEHVTNSPAGFSKRMIVGYVTSEWSTNTSRAGLINDLRAVIAKFMGRDEPKWNATSEIVSIARQRHGEWLILDGGALKLRCYLKGTAHLEVHPDMAWRLNQVLHSLYPKAIPAQFRKKPARKDKHYQLIQRPLPFTVIEVLQGLKPDRHNQFVFHLAYQYQSSTQARTEAIKVLQFLGGVVNRKGEIEFDYRLDRVLNDVIAAGCLPDRTAFQYFPTPKEMAEDAAAALDIHEGDWCLEPSAGQGNLAMHLPKERTRCIEISKLHAQILTEKGFDTLQIDFLEYARTTTERFDKVLMNPPFSDGRALAHLEAAASLVKPQGGMVAILPLSMNGKEVLPGWGLEWLRTYNNEFAGTGVSVVMLRACRV
ncbi:MAG: DUF4942 domain-containing protein [Undibacterium umbellatum]|uniref:DUF4942 domain-containing protein n=1 Tax=Undibacterium umbellatum TaxID=2762300 RepID=UPI003BB4D2C7